MRGKGGWKRRRREKFVISASPPLSSSSSHARLGLAHPHRRRRRRRNKRTTKGIPTPRQIKSVPRFHHLEWFARSHFVPFLPSPTDDGSLLLLLCLPSTLLLLLFSHPLLPQWQEIRPTLSTLPTVSQKSSTNFVESRSLEKTDSRPPPMFCHPLSSPPSSYLFNFPPSVFGVSRKIFV